MRILVVEARADGIISMENFLVLFVGYLAAKISIVSIVRGEDYFQEAPRFNSRARSVIKEANEGMALRPLTRSLTYAIKLTPNFCAVAANVWNVSQAATPAGLRGPKLTSRLRTRRRTANSEALLCKGISG